MKSKSTILIAAFLLALCNLTFGQASSASATYSIGNIQADRSFGNPTQSSACPGTLAVNIPTGSTITSVDVVYDFEALPGSFFAFQRSQLRCVSPGGLAEPTLATNPNWVSGVLTYSRSNLNIANGVAEGGDILFELHAGSSGGSWQGCSEQFMRVLNNTWTVTVHYLPPAFPDPPTNPNPADKAANVPINVGGISWNFGENSNFYDLYFGTTNPPTNKVVDNQAAGTTGAYSFGTLTSGTQYYWQVVVRNEAGLQLVGPLWNFSTECLPTSGPVATNFDNLNAPNYAGGDTTKVYPLCWNLLYQNSQWYASQSVVATLHAYSAPNCWIFTNEGDPNGYSFMILPEMNVPLSTLQLSFMAKGNGGTTVMSVGTMISNTDASTYTEFSTFSTTTFYQQYDIPFASYSGTDKYVALKFTSPGPNTYRYIFVDNVLLAEIPTCPRPKNLKALEVMQTTAVLTWEDLSAADEWNIEVVEHGETPTGNFITTSSKPFTVEGLQPSTDYDFYVQANCGNGNLSYWSNQGFFTTPCEAVTIPIFENFDASTAIPDCWSVYKTPGGIAQIAGWGSYSPPNNFRMSVASIENDVAMLISPPLDVPGGIQEVKLNLFVSRSGTAQSVIVGTITNPLDPTTFTPIQSLLPTATLLWTPYEIWFNNYEGADNYIAFKCGNLNNIGTVYLDDINIGLLPYCLNPVDLYVTEINETSARLNFTESREATSWQIEVGHYGFTPGTGAAVQTYTYDLIDDDYSFVMTGLTPGTFYQVSMRADCGGGDVSLWSPPADFMSQPEIFAPLPFYETFDPGFNFTIQAPTNNVDWTLFTDLYVSAPNSARNQYIGTNNNVLLISKRFDLSGKTNAFLSFWHIAKTQANRDHCYVEISTDGGINFDQLPAELFLGVGNYVVPTQNFPEGPCFNEASYINWGTGMETPDNSWWRNENFDLSAYSGSDNVVIRFRLASDNFTDKFGWLIDDISIKTYTEVVAQINPAAMDVELQLGETTTENMYITNNGDLPLVYTASVQNYTDALIPLVDQDFEAGLPTDWTIINGPESSPQSQWTWAQPGVAQYDLNGTNYMFVGRQFPDTCSEVLLSPSFDATGYSNLYLTFDHVYARATSGNAIDYAEVFVWDGSEWQSLLYMKTLNVGAWGNPVNQVFDITQFANPEMQLKFYYAGSSISRWGVDNVKVGASTIPLDWLTLNGQTTFSGVIQGGETQSINVGFEARLSFPEGKWNAEIGIVSNDPNNSPFFIPVSMTIGCPQPWTYTQTGLTHTISIPANVVPEIFGEPLAEGDWIGVFYLDDNEEEACGGAVQWNSAGVAISAFGNDQTTPEKDGFDAGETFIWRLKKCGIVEQYRAQATYSNEMPNQGNFAGFGLSKLTSLQAALIQNFTLNQGWNSISSYIIPNDPAVENMFEPIVNNLTILSNLTSMYWPSQGTNSIGNWDNNSGYTAKMTTNVDFSMAGTTYANSTITLPAGWSYLPVLSQCPVSVAGLFANNLSDVVIIQELIGTGIFWPTFGVYTLETLTPGKAYKIKLNNQITVTFPECSMKSSTDVSPQINKTATAWGTLNMTPVSQLAVFLPGALTTIAEGDIIGAFDQNGKIFGYIQTSASDQNQTITLFGDDVTSMEKDGFIDDEPIIYKLLRTATGEVFDLEVEYSPVLENASGNFIGGSFAAISTVKAGATAIGDPATSNVRIYPNPANDIINIAGISGRTEIRIFNVFGEEVFVDEISTDATIQVGSLAKGTYIIRFSTESGSTHNKLIIK